MKQINKFQNNIIALLLIAVTGGFFTGCDAADEITEANYDRVFSVNEDNLTVNVTNSTTLRLTWDKVHNADSYTIELFANDPTLSFQGTPSVIEEEIEYQSPYLIQGLDDETTYSGRIKGVSKTTSDSHWITFTFQTAMENIFNAIGNGLGATSVTLSWEPGLDVAYIIVRDINGNEVTRHDITTAEIATGTATVTGLEGLTTYTAQIYNNVKSRGIVTFTTDPDLGDAIQVNPEDDFSALLAAAEDGDTFAFMPGEYVIGEVSITKSIAFMAASSANKPVISGAFKINASISSLNFTNIVLTADNPGGDKDYGQAIEINADNLTIGDIQIQSCTIRGFIKGFIYNNKTSEIDSFTMDDCIMSDIGADNGGDTFDFRKGPTKIISITNSTFYNFPVARDFIRMDNDGYPTFGKWTTTSIENCTFYNVAAGATNKAFFYVRYTSSTVTMKNCLIMNADCPLARSAPSTVTISYNRNVYYNADKVIEQDGSGSVLNPGFADPENGDFTVTNEDVYFSGAGDPRWLQ